MSEQITKIKVNKDLTAIVYYKNSSKLDTREIVFKGGEKITNEFNQAFQNTTYTLTEIIPGLQSDIGKLKMTAVAFDYKGSNLDKVSYIAEYKPQKGITAELPIKKVPIFREDIKSFSVSGKDVELLNSILDYAKKYIEGETRTKQMKIEVA